MDQLKDEVAVVTGGASGIGRALCEELGRRGKFVIVTDINTEGTQDVASAINASGGRARASRLDVSQAEDVQKLIDEIDSEHGRLDYMFNNAGVSVTGEVRDMTLEHWRGVIDINLLGVLYGTTAAYSLMVRQGFGHIVNVASLAGLIGFPTNVPYATTKSAIVGLSTSLRTEAADLGVKVSVVCPAYVQSNIYYASTMLKVEREDVLATIPFKPMDTTQAARVILRGVARNQEIIVFPFYARLLWWLYRLHPALLAPLARKTVKDFRAIRCET